LNDDSIYDTKAIDAKYQGEGGNIVLTTKYINELLLNELFPLYKLILQDSDPLPLFGLKLLSAILEKNPEFS
jgi:hypothetical protein